MSFIIDPYRFALASNYYPLLATFSPSHLYKLVETAGSVAVDSIGSLNLTVVGTPHGGGSLGTIQSASYLGNGVGDYLYYPTDHADLRLNANRTFIAWCVPGDQLAGSFLANAGCVFSNFGLNDYLIRYYDNQASVPNKFTWGATPGISITSSGTFPPGSLYMVAVTYNTSNSVHTLYVNGVSRGTFTGATSSTSTGSPTDNFVIGSRVAGPEQFIGQIGAVSVHPSVLTSQNILDLYNAGIS